MTYFISDIHGEYDLFCKLLDHIQFSSCDTMIVLGDIIDKGPQSLMLLDLIADTNNIIAIMGNHEHAFVQYINSVFASNTQASDDEVLAKISQYFPDDTGSISWQLLDYIQQLPYYVEGDSYICVHAGVQLDDNYNIVPMSKQNKLWMVYSRDFTSSTVVPNSAKTVLFGHTPCHYHNGTGQFIKHQRSSCCSGNKLQHYSKIQIDTGVTYTGILGCLRLEDMQEFYVK